MFQARLLTELGKRAAELSENISRRCRPARFRDDQWLLDSVRPRVAASKSQLDRLTGAGQTPVRRNSQVSILETRWK
jgi:hypothetical protein